MSLDKDIEKRRGEIASIKKGLRGKVRQLNDLLRRAGRPPDDETALERFARQMKEVTVATGFTASHFRTLGSNLARLSQTVAAHGIHPTWPEPPPDELVKCYACEGAGTRKIFPQAEVKCPWCDGTGKREPCVPEPGRSEN